MTNYIALFSSANGNDIEIQVESPLEISCEQEDNVHDILDIATIIAKLQYGGNFIEKYEIFAESLLTTE